MSILNWKTAMTGAAMVLMGLGALGLIIKKSMDGEPVTLEEVNIALATIGAGFGFIFGRAAIAKNGTGQ